MSDTDQEAGIPLMEPLSPSPSPDTRASGSKRKRQDQDQDEAPAPQTKAAKRKKAKNAKKAKQPKDIEDDALDLDAGVNHAIAHMDSQLLADHIAQRTKRFHADLSDMELDEMQLPCKSNTAESISLHHLDRGTAHAIVDTTCWDKPRNLDNLPAFIERFKDERRSDKPGKTLSDAVKQKSTPHTIVIAGSGIRAANLTRALRVFQTKESFIAKLFAKHIKLDEAITMVKETKLGMAVGTPHRLIDLFDHGQCYISCTLRFTTNSIKGALSAGRLERIIIDASHIDQKKRGILDMKDTESPLIKLLTRANFKEKYNEDKMKKIELIFY
jgi:protein CMS1